MPAVAPRSDVFVVLTVFFKCLHSVLAVWAAFKIVSATLAAASINAVIAKLAYLSRSKRLRIATFR